MFKLHFAETQGKKQLKKPLWYYRMMGSEHYNKEEINYDFSR